jgi:hypothetical protein
LYYLVKLKIVAGWRVWVAAESAQVFSKRIDFACVSVPNYAAVLARGSESMDLSSLASLGRVAGLGGIALGVVALLVRPIIDRTSGVPAAQRASLLRFVAMGAFGTGGLGIVAWLVGGLAAGPTVTAGAGGVAGGRDVSGNTISIGQLPQGGGASPSVASAGVTAGPGGVAGGRDVSGNRLTIGQPQGGEAQSPAASTKKP